MSGADTSAGQRVAAGEAVAMASDLIAFDTSNHGDPHARGTERPAAEYVAGRLADVGYDVTYVESGAPGRGNVVARLTGADPSRGALLLHGHLDVVPADAADWTVHPFSGEVRDGYVWGRGAVDMKGAVAIMLAVARRLRREGVTPPRDLIFAFVADEEAGGWYGARWLVDNRPDLFEGATEAIGEVGGFSVTLGSTTPGSTTTGEDVRAYLVQTAEKGSMWLRLAARGRGGHGSMLHDDNAIAALAAAVARLDAHRFPLVLTDPIRALLTGIADITGAPFDEADPQAAVDRLGPLARLVGAALRDTANVTLFDAGYRSNVVPATARATVDGRFLPGREEAFGRELVEVLGPRVLAEWDTLPPVGTSFDGALVAAIEAAIEAEDPGARVLPYLLAAGTDAKSFQRLGIRHLGFTPLRLPPELDFSALFHGVDERVPVAALEFGTRVLDRLLRTC
ncbi:acetylornithine deacetylase/succinyldiaminopimelate desuccinylase-like deacylase [Frankia torreyi]|uniref:Acetylornithine deacetylase/succinyldiaminopimelate desuccinylase-like deacylase n=1 Tax=Frankia torreyi TaxID=1856 RepID=A0A0D8BBK8_9ACTN|nr:M20/M25/M40 family metallo-hydrolase [Frankia torreyi]KJE20747.1 acetylornithine deacetylase/succinyldiaminopimelate desuccinylase-like deacylase [Frankia torreyi]